MSVPQSASAATLLRPERHLRLLLRVLAVTFVGEIGWYLHYAWSGPMEARPFAVNSVAKDLLFLVLALVAAANVRRFARLVWFLIVGHVAIGVVLVALWVAGRPDTVFPPFPVIDESWRLRAWLVHGFENLRVCDASVFPSAITVNPQLTVMALAHHAAINCM